MLCTTDYIIIPNTGVAERFCGTDFETITSKYYNTSLVKLSNKFSIYLYFSASLKPFVLYVVTDNTETPTDLANKGFSLMFRQLICSI